MAARGGRRKQARRQSPTYHILHVRSRTLSCLEQKGEASSDFVDKLKLCQRSVADATSANFSQSPNDIITQSGHCILGGRTVWWQSRTNVGCLQPRKIHILVVVLITLKGLFVSFLLQPPRATVEALGLDDIELES